MKISKTKNPEPKFRRPTRGEYCAIGRLLDQHCRKGADGLVQYDEGWDDLTVATVLNLKRSAVSSFRQNEIGPLHHRRTAAEKAAEKAEKNLPPPNGLLMAEIEALKRNTRAVESMADHLWARVEEIERRHEIAVALLVELDPRFSTAKIVPQYEGSIKNGEVPKLL
jgi:hypothetical protein